MQISHFNISNIISMKGEEKVGDTPFLKKRSAQRENVTHKTYTHKDTHTHALSCTPKGKKRTQDTFPKSPHTFTYTHTHTTIHPKKYTVQSIHTHSFNHHTSYFYIMEYSRHTHTDTSPQTSPLRVVVLYTTRRNATLS